MIHCWVFSLCSKLAFNFKFFSIISYSSFFYASVIFCSFLFNWKSWILSSLAYIYLIYNFLAFSSAYSLAKFSAYLRTIAPHSSSYPYLSILKYLFKCSSWFYVFNLILFYGFLEPYAWCFNGSIGNISFKQSVL